MIHLIRHWASSWTICLLFFLTPSILEMLDDVWFLLVVTGNFQTDNLSSFLQEYLG